MTNDNTMCNINNDINDINGEEMKKANGQYVIQWKWQYSNNEILMVMILIIM